MEVFVIALTTFFATVGPLDVAVIFAALTAKTPPQWRRAVAIRAVCVAAIILLCFAFFGQWLLVHLGVSLASFKIAGGILLLLIGIDMVFARQTGGTSTTQEETDEATHKKDISVFPLAMPLIAGPGSLGAMILLITESAQSRIAQLSIIAAMLLVLVITLSLMLLANKVERLLGVTGIHVVSRIFGVLLASLAVQFIIDGLVEGPLFAAIAGFGL